MDYENKGFEPGGSTMDIGTLVNEVEKARHAVLQGNIIDAIQNLYRLKKTGFQVDISAIEDVMDLRNFLQYLYDETSIGDAITATRCLAALKGLDLEVDAQKINYVRYKKLAMLGKLSTEEYIQSARPAFRKLILQLRSFHVMVGDFRECAVHRIDNRVSFQEEITLRFPNQSFRDAFLQTAFRIAVDKGLNFNWENRTSFLNSEMTGHIGWFITQNSGDLGTDWNVRIKGRFDDFILELSAAVDHLHSLRCTSQSHLNGLNWVVFSRDLQVSNRICEALGNHSLVPIHDLETLQSWFAVCDDKVSAFIFHVSIRDFDVIQHMVNFKLMRDKVGPPFIVMAENPFFHVMKDPSQLFSGCESVLSLTPESIQSLEFCINKTVSCRRRFVRIPVDIRCHANLSGRMEHTRATPISPAGTLLKTHRIVPVFSPAQITLYDPESGFEENLTGNVIYNQRGGSAVRFDNVIPFEKFQQLQTITMEKHRRIVDTFQRSVL